MSTTIYVTSYAGHFAHGLGPGEWVRLQQDMVDYHREFRVDHPSDSSPLLSLSTVCVRSEYTEYLMAASAGCSS